VCVWAVAEPVLRESPVRFFVAAVQVVRRLGSGRMAGGVWDGKREPAQPHIPLWRYSCGGGVCPVYGRPPRHMPPCVPECWRLQRRAVKKAPWGKMPV